ncbi:DUF3152 domain-containing protein [Actinocorallia sp. A-T 12471]|uniref:DUF3152 domain-containing protein n=1 Tax=Actinocorallia sp. A-T 12471 TaxID=3089813 RepID=UPI0029D24E18|nr:DUF3152 domain-containing protein [Actinocorallia sp. A-T 12471]MDX6743994.1 DUF3152 domain-containing protein [Actinocorallia sp. A-T 12471]
MRSLRLPAGIALALAATATATLIALPDATTPTPTTPTPTPTAQSTTHPRPTPTPTIAAGRRQPLPRTIPRHADGAYRTAPGTDPSPRRTGTTIRYLVEVEHGLPYTPAEFATAVHTILNDPRGWPHRFIRVAHGPADLRVSLTSPKETRQRCLPLDVGLTLSCFQAGRAVINADRWNTGAPSYGRDIATYREYLINHEVGHGLGHGHTTCPGPDRPAPVMVQQTKSLFGCRPNPWPHPRRADR